MEMKHETKPGRWYDSSMYLILYLGTYMSKIKLFQLPITIPILKSISKTFNWKNTIVDKHVYFYPIKLNYTTVDLN